MIYLTLILVPNKIDLDSFREVSKKTYKHILKKQAVYFYIKFSNLAGIY